MNLTTVEGMRSEIFVPVTPKPVFTELKKPLSECKVAFITAGGIHKKDQTPFNTSGDFTYRVIPFDTPSSNLMVTHGGFDNSDINKDVNAMFPIDRLHELVAEASSDPFRKKRILHGRRWQRRKIPQRNGSGNRQEAESPGVDVVLCTGGCGTCHRSATIVTRCCEAEGMSCCVIAALPPIAVSKELRALQRRTYLSDPMPAEPNNHPHADGHPQGIPGMVRDCPSYNGLKVLPYEYRHNV